MPGSGELGIRPWSLRVTPDSDVTRKAKDMANAGSRAVAGVGSRCPAWKAGCFKDRRVGVWPE
jgi:hypothetical protein